MNKQDAYTFINSAYNYKSHPNGWFFHSIETQPQLFNNSNYLCTNTTTMANSIKDQQDILDKLNIQTLHPMQR